MFRKLRDLLGDDKNRQSSRNYSANVLKMPTIEEMEIEQEVDPPGNTDPSSSIPFWRRSLTFMVAMAASTTAFNLYSFVVYLNDIKSYFHLTQSQVEMVIAMNYLGMTSTLPAGFLIAKFGIRAGALLALVLPPVAYSLIYSATQMVPFYNSHVWLLVIYFFLAGCGSGVTYLTAMTAATPLFPANRRGTVIALVTSGTNIGALIFILLYTYVFQQPHAKKPNLPGFFGLIAILFSIFNLLGVILFREVDPVENGYTVLKNKSEEKLAHNLEPVDEKETENLIKPEPKVDLPEPCEATTLLEMKAMQKYGISLSDLHPTKPPSPVTDVESGYIGSEGDSDKSMGRESVSSTGSQDNDPVPGRSVSFRELLREPIFLLMGSACVITIGLVSMDLNNLLVFTVSLGMTKYSEVLPYLAVVIGLIGKMSIGYVSDITIHKIQRATYILIMLTINTGLYALCIFFLNNVFVLIINPILVTTGSVVVFSLIPTILSEQFGSRSFAKAWGIIYFGTAVSGFFFQNMLGWIYDAHVEDKSTNTTCYGQKCFSWSFVVATVMTSISTVLVAIFMISKKRKGL